MTLPWRRPFTLLDGGLSTALEELGQHPSGPLWTAEALIARPDVVVAAHRRAVEAGADVVITASYQASVPGFVASGLSVDDARRVLASTTSLARDAGASAVACSVGPYGACRADGSEYSGRYDVSWDDVRSFHRARLEVLVPTRPDVFAIETMPTAREAAIVVDELRRLTDGDAWVTFTCRDEVHTWGGDRFVDAVHAVAGRITAVGLNCTAPRMVTPLLRALHDDGPVGMPLVDYPNHGADWDADRHCWSGPVGGAEIPGLVGEWLDLGVAVVGGCCGVGTATVSALADLRRAGAAEG